MAGTHYKKQQITAALGGVRIQLQNELLLLRRNLNVGQHILESIRNHPWAWISNAAIFGWLLSRVPVRKKRIYIYSSSREQVKSHGNGPLGKLWKGAWRSSKPLIAAYLAKKLAEQAKMPGSK
ncbi:MAG: hypothetical protein WB586_01045 [Chthoniobacterales bacterium]